MDDFMDSYLSQLNASQKEAVLYTGGPLIIFAGAGTGKTRVITSRIAFLLSQGIAPANILAVTSTNKAAEEMRRRVDQLVPGRGRSVWISTFHSFCAHLLRCEAVNIGLNPEFLIYDTGASARMSATGRMRSCPRVYGTTQNAQNSLQPSMMVT
jgi:DNA helicase-2/ATP-dependent DNA helicase PcrA